MVFNPNQNLGLALWGLLVFWAVILTLLFFKIRSHYHRLTYGIDKKTLGAVLEKILKDQEVADQKIEELVKRAEKAEKEGLTHVRKVGLLRFNPFEEVGSDQSFVLSLLDAEDNGIVLTSLTSRSGTRWFGKTVKKGEGLEHELSKEEKEALHKAQGKL